jgi:hypothetical protein
MARRAQLARSPLAEDHDDEQYDEFTLPAAPESAGT